MLDSRIFLCFDYKYNGNVTFVVYSMEEVLSTTTTTTAGSNKTQNTAHMVDIQVARGSLDSRRSSGHLIRILVLLSILLVTSITVVVIFVTKNQNNKSSGLIPIKPELFTPPTLLAK